MDNTITKVIKHKALFLIVLILFVPLFGFSKNDKEKTVVFLSSFHENNRWTQSCHLALENKFKEEGYSIKLNSIYLDAKNIVNPEIRKDIIRLYFSEYQDAVDLIVAFDYEATDLILNYSDSNISKIPIVFISELEHDRIIDKKNVTGTISDYGIEQTYLTGLKMFPKTKKVYVWADKSTTGIFFLNEAKHKLKHFEGKMEIEYGIDANSTQEFLAKCKKIDTNSFVIFCTWQRDDNGKYHVASDFYPQFLKATPAPVFTALDNCMGCGFIGGYLQSPINNGRAAAEMAIRIFNGEKPENMPIEYLKPIPLFDVHAIREKGGIRSALAFDSNLINSFDEFFRENLTWIVFASVLLLIILILIFIHIKNRKLIKKIKNKVEEEKKLKADLKLLSLALPSLNTITWSYNGENNKFIYGDIVEIKDDKSSKIDNFEKVLAFIHPDDKDRIVSFLKDFIKKDSGDFSFVYRGNYQGRGKYSWWECRGILETREDKNGPYKFLYGMDINIDKFKETENQLSYALERAVQSDKLKSAFLSNISHEIRTPLNAIVGFSELIMETDNMGEKEEYCNIVKQNNDLLLKLISDILDLSKIESGFLEINKVKFDLKQYFEELVGLFQHKLNEEVELICDNPHKSCIVEFDKVRLTQIITNYVDNAIKFTNKGYIKIGYEIIDKGIKIYCEDTGIGIKKDYLPKVFERFEKLNSFEQGTGLGLAISKSITEAVGGKYGVESIEGEGSLFWSWLPCDVIIIDDENQKSINIEIEYTKDTTEKRTILIAEDVDSHYMLMEEMLKNDYNIIRSTNGLDAVLKARNENPDIIIMNIIMPMMDGLDAIRMIRDFNESIPIIAITDIALESDRREAFNAGCDDFLTKPIDERKLYEILKHIEK